MAAPSSSASAADTVAAAAAAEDTAAAATSTSEINSCLSAEIYSSLPVVTYALQHRYEWSSPAVAASSSLTPGASSSSVPKPEHMLGGIHALQHSLVMLVNPVSDDLETRIPNVEGYTSSCLLKEEDGGLVIFESIGISKNSLGDDYHRSGIWSEDQISIWKTIMQSVKAKKNDIYFAQLTHMGRVAHPGVISQAVSSTAKRLSDSHLTPVALTADGIHHIVQCYKTAARSAIDAGFHGVEINAGDGFLLEQFLKDRPNDRRDEFGGDVSQRSSFFLRVIKDVKKEIGANRLGVKFTPFDSIHGCTDSDAVDLINYLGMVMGEMDIAYLHFTQTRVGTRDRLTAISHVRNVFLGKIVVTGAPNQDALCLAKQIGAADLTGYSTNDVPYLYSDMVIVDGNRRETVRFKGGCWHK
ncbi:hypothetical protein ABFS83_14G149400 [Erythranthe nasuta]